MRLYAIWFERFALSRKGAVLGYQRDVGAAYRSVDFLLTGCPRRRLSA